MIKIGIIGGTGYTAGELIRLLIYHPKAKIISVVSKSNPECFIHDVHQDILGEINMTFSKSLDQKIDLVFLCSGHDQSRKELQNIPKHSKVIDLSQDFRNENQSSFKDRKFIYGLPELHRNRIKESNNIANPGCFATAIILAILPLAKKKLLKKDIHISSITGSTGSGKQIIDTNNFSWRNNNISTYNIFTHQHLNEIEQTICQLQNNFSPYIYFVPYRGNFSRGIISTVYTTLSSDISLEKKKTYIMIFIKIIRL